MASLIFHDGDGTPQACPLGAGITTIGRTSENTIVLDDSSVSSRHAEIRHVDGKYSVQDLGSSNGTILNGSPIQDSALNDGDVVCFGGVEGTFSARAAEATATPTPTETSSTKKEAAASSSFVSKLKGLAGAVWSETRMAGKLTALKAKLSKLKTVDLNAAHYALGKKCYELALHKEKLESEFAAIGELKKQIAEKKAGKASEDEESNTQRAKRVFGNVAGKAGAHIVELKLKRTFVLLGRCVEERSESDGLKTEMNTLQSVRSKLRSLENECSRASASNSTNSHFRRVVLALTIFAGALFLASTLVPKSWTRKGQISLGDMYAEGREVSKDVAQAVEWYSKAAKAGSAEAQVKLASIYMLGWLNGQPDDKLAMEWYRKAAVQGSALGQHYLGWMYHNGRGIAKNDIEGFKWCSKAAQQGYRDSQTLLGLMYFDGSGTNQDYTLSAKWHRLAAEQGNPTSQMILGGMYLKGVGVSQSNTESIKWMQKAADAGDSNAEVELGILYFNGTIIEQDKTKGLALLEKAANHGNQKAKNEMRRFRGESSRIAEPRFGSKQWRDSASEEDKKLLDMILR